MSGAAGRSIAFAGHDFAPFCSAVVTARAANPIVAEAISVPGRAGALLVSGRVPPVDVSVRLYLDAGYRPDIAEAAELRARLRSWLTAPHGGTLVLPDDPEVEYRDAMLVGASGWSDLFEAGSCELTFTLFDPVGYGAERVERAERFEVGGTWPTLPAFELVAAAGSSVGVSHPSSGRAVRVERAFAGGEAVVIDCADESVAVDGSDARADVALGSDFFSLSPGEAVLSASGASDYSVRFTERWL